MIYLSDQNIAINLQKLIKNDLCNDNDNMIFHPNYFPINTENNSFFKSKHIKILY